MSWASRRKTAYTLSFLAIILIIGFFITPSTIFAQVGATAPLSVSLSTTTNPFLYTSTKNQLIGQYFLSTKNSSEGIKITSIIINLVKTPSFQSISNLYISENGVSMAPINTPTIANNFSTDFTIPTDNFASVNIYGDVGTSSSTFNIPIKLTVNGYGTVSNTAYTVNTPYSYRYLQPQLTHCGTSTSAVQQAIQVANNYLISKVGQSYFNEHYKPLGLTTGGTYPIVFYDYTLNGTTYSIETLTGKLLQNGGDFLYMDVMLSDDFYRAS